MYTLMDRKPCIDLLYIHHAQTYGQKAINTPMVERGHVEEMCYVHGVSRSSHSQSSQNLTLSGHFIVTQGWQNTSAVRQE